MSGVTKKPSFALLFGLGATLALVEALASYAQSSYLSQFFSLSQIGFIAAASCIITLIWSSFHPGLIAKHGNYHSALITASLVLLSHIALAYSHTPWLIVIAVVLRYACLALLYVNLDLALEAISTATKIGSIRTKYLSIMNLAWLASPLLMTSIIGDNNYQGIYAVSIFIIILFLIILLCHRRYLQQAFRFQGQENNWLNSLSLMFKDSNLRPVFLSALTLQMFYSFAVLYIPIYLHQTMHIAWSDLGWIFTFMLIAFVVIQLPAGLMADRYWGEKELLISGSLIIAAACICIYLATSASPWFWAWLLLFSRVGAALCEAMQEVYFFKQVTSSDLGLINLFRQSRSLGWLLGTTSAALLLLFTNIPNLFLIMSGIFIINTLWLRKIVDTK